MKARIALLVVVTTAAVACSPDGGSTPSVATSRSPTASRTPGTASPTGRSVPASPTTAPPAAIVGRWQRVVRCQELAGNLTKAGLGSLAPYAWLGQTSASGESSFEPGSPQPTSAHPCTGAIARVHSHFFNEAGQFGSLDWEGGQVDDGTYRIVNDHTLLIGKTTFRYRVNGDTLMLDPVLTKAMIRRAVAHPRRFSEAGWAVSVAYAGYMWKRVPCDAWC
jgi:hypothetical protein